MSAHRLLQGRLLAVMAVVLVGGGGPASAADFDLTAWLGPAFPFYEQTFEYDPGPLSLGPGAVVDQRGIFTLDARGGIALGAAAAWHFSRHLGLELRLDTADVHVRTQGARYNVTVRLPPPLPPTLSRELDLGTGNVDVERVRPLSLNLRLRTGGPLRVVASAGGSWLPRFRLVAHQAVQLDVPELGGVLPVLPVADVALAAEALPADRDEGRFGFNAGAGLQNRLSRRVSVMVEGRYFWFQQQTLHWGLARSNLPLPPLEAEVIRQIEEGLEPAKFNPTFFQVTAGVVVSF